MKAVTIYEPHALLVAILAKRFETRIWTPNLVLPCPIAIHAAQTTGYLQITYNEPFRSVLKAAGIRSPKDIPLGCILCTANLIKVWKVEELRNDLSHEERAFGDYSDGRFAWEFANVQAFTKPIPVRGNQGLWEWRQTP